MSFKFILILFVSFFLFACSGNSDKTSEPTIKETLKKADLLAGVPFKKLPLVDSTNFDNFEEENELSKELISKLKLKSLDPNYEHFYSRYRLALSTGIDAVVVTLAAENELKTFLVTYRNDDYQVIDQVMISYDEIAESAFRSIGKLSAKEITVTNYNYYTEDGEPIIEVKRYHIDSSGTFKEGKI